MRYIIRIAEEFYNRRGITHRFQTREFEAGSIQRKGGRVFITAPCDTFCEMKGRSHVDDERGNQTYYSFDWARGIVKQGCYSCPMSGAPQQTDTHRFTLEEAIVQNVTHSIVYYMALEIDTYKLNVVETNNNTAERSGVWIYDAFEPGGGAFNAKTTDTQLWMEGGDDYLSSAIVIPWLEDKLNMVLSYTCAKIDPTILYKKVMAPQSVSNITKGMRSSVSQRIPFFCCTK